jgi:CheY-like chemotaxis protein
MPLRALVCDDDRPVRAMVREILESKGVSVIEAGDGSEALSIFLKEKLDLVVIDFLMPKIDGLQVIRDIRATGARGKIPVVLMSAISKSQILGAQEWLGPDAYINKPFKPRKMAKLLDELIAKIAPKPS